MPIHTDILILGCGLSGAAVVHLLRKKGYTGKITVIEKEHVASQRAYGYRNTTKEIIDRYQLPFVKTFLGLRDGITINNSISWLDLNHEFYFYDYSEVCEYLLLDSDVNYVKEKMETIDFENNIVRGNNSEFSYTYLIDCTGYNSWTKVQASLLTCKKFYIGYTFQVPITDIKQFPKNYTNERFVYYSEDNGYMEDFYEVANTVCMGYWNYSSKPVVDLQLKKNALLSQFKTKQGLQSYQKYPVIIPAEPSYPLIYKNIAYLGDSAGQATPASSEGTRPIFEAAELLSESIIETNDLKQYQKKWTQKNLLNYTFQLEFKDDLYQYNKFFNKLREYPQIYMDLILNKWVSIPFSVLFSSVIYLFKTTVKTLIKWYKIKATLQK